MSVTASPADYNSWEAVRNELMSEAKKGLKARVEAEVAAAKEGDDLDAMKLAFQGEERDLEHSIDHEVHSFACTLDVSYNVRLRPVPSPLARLDAFFPLCAVSLKVDAERSRSIGIGSCPRRMSFVHVFRSFFKHTLQF